MRRLQRLAILLVVVSQAAAYPCTPNDLESCPKAPGGLRPDQVPQFITVTWDDGISPFSYGLVDKILGGLKQRNDCPIPSTYFICVTDTIPAAVQALYMAGNEIATHTMTHVGNPSREEIVGARTWLANATGIPESKIVGFRAPFLLHDEQGRNALADAGFLYDSSIPDNVPSKISPSLEQRSWPYRMDQGIPQDCDTGSCSPSERHNLWEVPLWSVADENGQPIASMDPPGNAYDNYKRELERRLAGNRAPLGLFFHAGLQSEASRVEELRKFIEYATSQPDVWFVTTQQLLAWMENPVPASRVEQQLKCEKPRDIKANNVCETFVGDCKFGTFDGTTCKCACMGEGTPGGYCPDPSTGECTVMCS
ncbi:hypothetical protein COHA_004128 [Chlorella ohadii]|uniref:NodB homology domain-containing protein n=1 Tax=Chlorella ohadii TaxID=2649997 RepID=A0AAD5DQQ1_9CHLO|nr:hypothetical protein COHA_004128 [Chlorella ohadii]